MGINAYQHSHSCTCVGALLMCLCIVCDHHEVEPCECAVCLYCMKDTTGEGIQKGMRGVGAKEMMGGGGS